MLQVELLRAVAEYFPPKGVPLGTLPKGSVSPGGIAPPISRGAGGGVDDDRDLDQGRDRPRCHSKPQADDKKQGPE